MDESSEKLRFIFLSGKGSSGKDTQADILLDLDPDLVKISTGEIYRGAKFPDGPFGKFYPKIAPFIEKVDKGNLLPDELMVSIVKEVIDSHISEGRKTFIFTGFPRTINQLREMDKMIDKMKGKYEVEDKFFYYALPNSLSFSRAGKRRATAISEGKKTRPDDEEKVVEKRLKTFRDETLPMLRTLAKECRLNIVKANRDISEIHKETRTFLGRERNE